MRFDVLLVSPDYAYQGEAPAFPRRRLSPTIRNYGDVFLFTRLG